MSRSEIVRVRLSEEEKGALLALCSDDQSQSDVVRRLLRDRAGLPLPVGPSVSVALNANSEALRRIGVNLNQAVRAMNEGRVEYEPQLAASLHNLLAGLYNLRIDIDRLLKIGGSGKGAGGGI